MELVKKTLRSLDQLAKLHYAVFLVLAAGYEVLHQLGLVQLYNALPSAVWLVLLVCLLWEFQIAAALVAELRFHPTSPTDNKAN